MAMKARAHIHSLNGEVREVDVLDRIGDNLYVVDYEGTKCTAIFNFFTGSYYEDDKYGAISEQDRTEQSPQRGNER